MRFVPVDFRVTDVAIICLDSGHAFHLPPAPTTKKNELTYHGFYQSAGGAKQTMVKFGDAFLTTTLGAKLTANLFVAEASPQALTITNLANQTNTLLLNTKKEIEVPIQ